ATYHQLYQVNVVATAALVRFATAGDETKPIHFVSTQAIFNTSERQQFEVIGGDDMPLDVEEIHSAYAQSKWVSEKMLRAVSNRGFPVTIHRPGLVVGHSQSGYVSKEDFLTRFIAGCVAIGTYPDLEVAVDMIAVDQLAAGIVACLRLEQPTSTGIIWSGGEAWSLMEVVKLFAHQNQSLEAISLDQWLDRIRSTGTAHTLFPLLPFLTTTTGKKHQTILEALHQLPLKVEGRITESHRINSLQKSFQITADLLLQMNVWMREQQIIPQTH
ncbi:MAG: SDR family oxidoreductase, partial [Bacteroidota bacterium]